MTATRPAKFPVIKRAELRARRELANMSRGELARKSGVSAPTVTRLESAGYPDTCAFRTLRALAVALGCDPDELTDAGAEAA